MRLGIHELRFVPFLGFGEDRCPRVRIIDFMVAPVLQHDGPFTIDARLECGKIHVLGIIGDDALFCDCLGVHGS